MVQRALAETLDLVRLNDPFRALLTLGVPVVALAISWQAIGQIAYATCAALAATLLFALVIFCAKLILAPAKIAADRTAELEKLQALHVSEDQARDRRVTLARLLSQAEHILREGQRESGFNQHMLDDWYSRTRGFLIESLGEEYLHRFMSDTGLPQESSIDVLLGSGMLQTRSWLERRATRLSEILQSLPPVTQPSRAASASRSSPASP